MSESDHTKQFRPRAGSAKRLTGPEGESSVRFKKCLGQKKKRYSASKELRQKRCYIWNTIRMT